VFVVPGSIDTRTGGYGYDRRIVGGLREAGWRVALHEIDASFPFPTPAARENADKLLARLPDEATVVVDGLAFGALAPEAERHAARLRFVALVHHPLAEETGLDRAVAASLEASERRALAVARLVVVTSPATARGLARYGVAASRVAVVVPGTDRAQPSSGSGSSTTHFVCVATLTPRKGHEVLLRALAALSHHRWHLTLVGGLDRDPPTLGRIRALVEEQGLAERVRFAGEAGGAALEAHYLAADVFVLATWHEGYGLVVAEALAHGLPVVSTRTGGIPDLVEPEGLAAAGLLVAPGDEMALGGALARIMEDSALRNRLRSGALEARTRLPSWNEAVEGIGRALEQVIECG
jgi:glycosyltransferase involved in cell wall biosynthesis